MPKRVDCTECGGTGKSSPGYDQSASAGYPQDPPAPDCPQCSGDGFVDLLTIDDVQRLADAHNAPIAGTLDAHKELLAVANDRKRCADDVAWAWAVHLVREWRL